jgi:two-component sensor histidine kinase
MLGEDPDAVLSAPSFISEGGECGALMRSLDWSASPLGPPTSWPASLQAVVSLMLGSAFPMFVAWGEDLGFLYNDPYAAVLGEKHPKAMGRRFEDIWSEIWSDILPLIDAAMAGQGVFREDLPLVMNRKGYDELTWFTFSYSPVRDADGEVGGMFCACYETTARVRSEMRQDILASLDNLIRHASDPSVLRQAAAQLLAQAFKADRVHWAMIDDAEQGFRVTEEFTTAGTPSLAGDYQLAVFGHSMIDAMRGGRTIAIHDIAEHLRDEGEEADPPVRSLIAAPLFRGPRWRAALCLHGLHPRRWSDEERILTREVAERVWTAADRLEAEKDALEYGALYRALSEATSEVIYRVSADWTELRQLTGRGVLTDTSTPTVAWQDTYLLAEDRPAIQAAIAEAVARKEVFQLEHRVRLADGGDGWIFSRAIPLLDADGEIVEWFGTASDVTARKEADRRLRLMVNELNHRVKNTLAAVQAIAAQTLSRAEVPSLVRETFDARLVALARAHDVLNRGSWSGAELRQIAELTAAAFTKAEDAGRVAISGPALHLPPKTTIALALAFHELATNAVKYGALSKAGGGIVVDWDVRPTKGGQHLRLTWTERGGPPVSAPTRQGFGTRMIERGLAADLGGAVRLDYAPTGLVCRIEAEIARAGPSELDAGL